MLFKNNLKNLIYWGLNAAFGFIPVRKAAILMYHSVNHNEVFFTVSPDNFKKQIDYLNKKKYNVVSLVSLADYLAKKDIPAKTIVLTFDDGYKDNYFNVFPLLKKYKFPATIFLSTGFIGKEKKSAGVLLPMLNWEEIEEMHRSGLVDFQPHTINHLKLTKVSLNEAEREILESRDIVEKNLNKKCHFFAYPYGDCNEGIMEILSKSGFKGALALREGLISNNSDLLSLKRNSIDSSVGFSQFEGKLGLAVDIFRKICPPRY